jgi:hypothetical protein
MTVRTRSGSTLLNDLHSKSISLECWCWLGSNFCLFFSLRVLLFPVCVGQLVYVFCFLAATIINFLKFLEQTRHAEWAMGHFHSCRHPIGFPLYTSGACYCQDINDSQGCVPNSPQSSLIVHDSVHPVPQRSSGLLSREAWPYLQLSHLLAVVTVTKVYTKAGLNTVRSFLYPHVCRCVRTLWRSTPTLADSAGIWRPQLIERKIYILNLRTLIQKGVRHGFTCQSWHVMSGVWLTLTVCGLYLLAYAP